MRKNSTLMPDDADQIESAIKSLSPIWTSAILVQLSTGQKRTKRILESLPGLSAKTFTERIRLLEKLGLVRREYFREVPPRVEYSLTKEGRNAIDLLRSVKQVISRLQFER